MYLSFSTLRTSSGSPLLLAFLHSLFKLVLNLIFSINSVSTQGADMSFIWPLPANFATFLLLKFSSMEDFNLFMHLLNECFFPIFLLKDSAHLSNLPSSLLIQVMHFFVFFFPH